MNAVPAGQTVFARWVPVYVGIGSNLQDPRAQVLRAIDALSSLPATRRCVVSPLYQTPPFGAVAQPAFVNAVAGLLTQLTPEEMLASLRSLEQQLGREPARERWGPRRIDLDLLCLGQERREAPALCLPHPGIAERDFVLYPLADIAPDLDIPGLGRVRTLCAQVQNRGVSRL